MKLYIVMALTVACMAAVVYLDSKHVVDFIRSQPTCFPPYILMREDTRQVPQGTYPSQIGADEGVRSPARSCRANFPSHSLDGD